MSTTVDIAIIGAGPYGLSLAAFLGKTQVSYRIFGKPMDTWRNGMPAGMSMKSEGFACNLYQPDGLFTLKDFCREKGIPYADIGIPVALSTFAAYGVEFQERFVSGVEQAQVVAITRDELFEIKLESGEVVNARKVVVAAGIGQYRYLPTALDGLSPEFVTHSSEHHRMEKFAGRDVLVIGAGSSAVDTAVALREAGARPQLVTRRDRVPFHGKAPDRRKLLVRIKAPWSGLGPSWRSKLCCDLPLVFHAMPLAFRTKVVKKHLGPAPGWFTRDKVVGHIPMHTSMSLESASVADGKVHLGLLNENGQQVVLSGDHVIAGTGYRVDVKRLNFMAAEMIETIETENGSPRLSSNFECSVPGLYFIGTTAALSFGPLMRFTFGAGFVSSRLSRHLARRVPFGRTKRLAGWRESKGALKNGMEAS